MISQKRIVHIFRHTGGSDEFTKSPDELTDEQCAQLREYLGPERPLIASMPSDDEWFAVTAIHLVLKKRDELRTIPLEQIERAEAGPKVDPHGNLKGGNLRVRLRDGSTVSLGLRSGRPYKALINVLMYIATVTGPRTGQGLAYRPTTSDKRRATKS